jgi:hypothetical protein
MAWHLAQLNVARLRAPLDDPLIADFVDNLEHVNGLGEGSPGYVWRLQTDAGDATGVRAFDDPLTILNLTVWTSVEALGDFVYRSGHVSFLRRKREWFERAVEAHLVMWWVPAGHLPTVEEALDRLEDLRTNGATARAFTFRSLQPPPDAEAHAEVDSNAHAKEGAAPPVDERNVCPA